MVRPLKSYVVLTQGRAEPVIYAGATDAKTRVAHLKGFRMDAVTLSFHTAQAAEEFVDWHNYRMWKRQQPVETSTGYCDRFVMSLF